MAFVSVTRLRLRSVRYFMPFAWYAVMTMIQSRRAVGNLGSIARRYDGAYWTISLWSTEAAMYGFRNSGAHRRAMPKLAQWCDEASYAHWQQEQAELPDWQVAEQRLQDQGQYSRVNHPSPVQRAGRSDRH